jgi:hypothetical protein
MKYRNGKPFKANEYFALPDGAIGIRLTRGRVAIIDEQDYDLVKHYTWRFLKRKIDEKGYAEAYYREVDTHKKVYVRMHNVIMNQLFIDHIDGDGLNNRRINLRPASTLQNHWNRGKSTRNTSGYKGVSWSKQKCKWVANIRLDGKQIHLGFFGAPEEAANAYNHAALTNHGEFAKW